MLICLTRKTSLLVDVRPRYINLIVVATAILKRRSNVENEKKKPSQSSIFRKKPLETKIGFKNDLNR